MATIKAGTYIFLANPVKPSTNVEADINAKTFDNNGREWTVTWIDAFETPNSNQGWSILIKNTTLENQNYGNHYTYGSYGTNGWYYTDGDADEYTVSDTTKLRTLIVSTAQTVNDNFYTWFIANTTYTSNQLSVDLTTLPGWANLSSGNHIIKIKAKGTGYKDSELSVGVTVSKIVTLSAGTYKFNDTLTLTSIDYDIEFTSNSQSFTRILRQYDNRPTPNVNQMLYYKSDNTYKLTYALVSDTVADWTDNAYQTITLSTDQQVSQEFYNWFTANANKVYTLEAGTYKWIDSPAKPSSAIQVDFNFVSNQASFTRFVAGLIGFNNGIYYRDPTEEEEVSVKVYDWTSWTTGYQTITLSTDQQVSPEFYKWAITDGNLVKQATGETWLLNETLTESNQDFTSLNFTSNSQSFVRIVRQYDNRPIPPVNSLGYYKSDGTYTPAVYTNDDGIAFWNNQAYRTITFDTAPTGDLLTWLQANGVKQTGYKLTLTSPTIYSGGSSDFYIKFNGTASATDYDIHCWGTGNNNPPAYPAYHIKDKSGNEISLPKDFTGITSLSTYAASTNYFGITVNGISIESESKTIDITGDATVSITIDSDY